MNIARTGLQVADPTVMAEQYVAQLGFTCKHASATPVPGTVERLVNAGAALVGPPQTTSGGDRLAMLRDPWGLAMQLCRRATPMV